MNMQNERLARRIKTDAWDSWYSQLRNFF